MDPATFILKAGYGADPNLENDDGQSPIAQARAEGKNVLAARLTSAAPV
jgi:hypothetical protein